MTVTTGPRITKCAGSPPAWPPLEANCSTRDDAQVTSLLFTNSDKYLALYVQGEEHNSDFDNRSNAIHWHSDVVIYAGPSPLLIIDSTARSRRR